MEDVLYYKELFEPIDLAVVKPKMKTNNKQNKLNKKANGHIKQRVYQSVLHDVAKEVDNCNLGIKLKCLLE